MRRGRVGGELLGRVPLRLETSRRWERVRLGGTARSTDLQAQELSLQVFFSIARLARLLRPASLC